ncbi:phospholipase-like protein [Tanacetum coccineum]
MDLSDYEVPRVLVTCRIDNFQIQFGKEEFCLVTGLKFGVKNWTDYNNVEEPIPFRRRVFSSSLDGRPIRGENVETLIKSEAFNKLDDNDAVSLCCVCILQLVLLGLEDRHPVPNWILRLANNREGWNKYPWDEIDKKSYLITGFAWAFKFWIPQLRTILPEMSGLPHSITNNYLLDFNWSPLKCLGAIQPSIPFKSDVQHSYCIASLTAVAVHGYPLGYFPSSSFSQHCSITLDLLVHQLVSNAYSILESGWIFAAITFP